MSQTNSFFNESSTNKLESDCALVDNLLVMDNDELSGCWMDEHHDIKPEDLDDIEEIGDCLSFSDDDNVSFQEDIFEDCLMEIEPLSFGDEQEEVRSSAASPPRTENNGLLRQDSGQTTTTTSSTTTTALPPVTSSSPLVTGNNNELYTATLSNLESSMRRSELSRAQVLQHRANMNSNVRDRMSFPNQYQQQKVNNHPHSSATSSLPQPSPSTFSSLGDLFSGKRTALTVGLEQSRNQLRMYMSMINTNQPF